MINVIMAAETLAEADAYDTVMSFAGFLAEMTRRGIPTSAFPAELLAISDLEDWQAKVRNGGNCHFLRNKGDQAVPMLERIDLLLRICGATAYADVVGGVLNWIRNNPEDVSRQTGFSGRGAPELDELDRAFWRAGDTSDLYEILACALLERPNVRLVPDSELNAALDTEALRLVEGSPEIQRSIVQSVAQKCREWLSDPMNMGLALASGKLQDGQLVSYSFGLDVFGKEPHGAQSLYVRLESWSDSGSSSNYGYVLLDKSGMRFVGDPKMEPVDLFVSRAEIRRATKMALAFRLPESTGLRWSKMARPFRVEFYRFSVMPGSKWLPFKWRVMWIGDLDWAVKGSPNRSTFAWGKLLAQTETMMQEKIAEQIETLGLKIGG